MITFRHFFVLVFVTAALTACKAPVIKYDSPNTWVEESKQGANLPLGTKADQWSYQKTFNTQNGKMGVRSNFLKQQGTTCHFDVEFANVGTTLLNGTAGLAQANKTKVYTHNSGKLNMSVGEKTTYRDLEARECPLKWGTSTEMDHCAACKITVLYAE